MLTIPVVSHDWDYHKWLQKSGGLLEGGKELEKFLINCN